MGESSRWRWLVAERAAVNAEQLQALGDMGSKAPALRAGADRLFWQLQRLSAGGTLGQTELRA